MTASDDRRLRATQAWLEIALAEHASIPSFARFSIELVALGAPPDLLERSARAMEDEVRHTKMAFAIASRLAGKSLGPSAINVEGALVKQPEWREVCRSTLLDGCIGEGVATRQAEFGAARSGSPEAKGFWKTVAREEARHAELAWSFLEWAVQQKPELCGYLQRELDRKVESMGLWPSDLEDELADLMEFGILSRADLGRIAVESVAEDIIPRAREVFAPVLVG
ncbi:MAG: hypothetical protein QNJ15_13185 [Erythrobacter sp.]|nr:hypothetical protein [Erythrobacter sp.]